MKLNKDNLENAYSLLRILESGNEKLKKQKYKSIDKTFKDVRRKVEKFKRKD